MKKLLSLLMLLSLILVSCDKSLDPKDIVRETKIVSIVDYVQSTSEIIPATFIVQVYFNDEEVNVVRVVTPKTTLDNVQAWTEKYALKYGDVLKFRITRVDNLTCNIRFIFNNYLGIEEIFIPHSFITTITCEHVGDRALQFSTSVDSL